MASPRGARHPHAAARSKLNAHLQTLYPQHLCRRRCGGPYRSPTRRAHAGLVMAAVNARSADLRPLPVDNPRDPRTTFCESRGGQRGAHGTGWRPLPAQAGGGHSAFSLAELDRCQSLKVHCGKRPGGRLGEGAHPRPGQRPKILGVTIVGEQPVNCWLNSCCDEVGAWAWARSCGSNPCVSHPC